MIKKQDNNTVKITRTIEETVDYETLVSQREGILEQQAQEHEQLEARDQERAAVLQEIEKALATGIEAKPEAISADVVEEIK